MTKDEKMRCDEVWFVVEAQEMKRVALEMERGTVEMEVPPENMMKVGSVLKCALEWVILVVK